MSYDSTSSLSAPLFGGIDIAAGAATGFHPANMRHAMAQNRCNLPSSARAGQRGVALVVALILLVVITLVGIAAVSGTIMQQKMASNFSDRQMAFQADEAALRQAESVVQALPSQVSASALPTTMRNCSPAAATLTQCTDNPFTETTATLPAANIISVSSANYDAGKVAAGQPQYVIEYMGNFKAPTPDVRQLSPCSGYAPCGPSNTADYYRITARSFTPGTQDRATATLQSMYRR